MDHNNLVDFINSRRIFSKTDKILLAVSGGIDSVVLAHLFRKADLNFAIAHCNFGLRGDESNADAAFVADLASLLKVPFFLKRFSTISFANAKRISIQMAARDLRYHWFEQIRNKNHFAYVATAHHLDDQVETFLINLIRGTGIAGLHGIPVKNDKIVRPMMFAWRKDIELFATEHEIKYRTDKSNSETVYLRNKVRHAVIPLLCTLNPEFTNGVNSSISRLRDFEQIGNQTLDKWFTKVTIHEGNDVIVNIEDLLKVTPQELYAWRLLSPYGFNESQVSNLLNSLKGTTRKLFLSDSHKVIKERNRLVIRNLNSPPPDNAVFIPSFEKRKQIRKPVALFLTHLKQAENYAIPTATHVASLDFQKLQFPLVLRKWQIGDSFTPIGMNKRKKVSDFFIDQKFTQKQKEETWILCSGNDIAWIVGHRIDNRFKITHETSEILSIVAKVSH